VFIGFPASASKAGTFRAGASAGVENPKQWIVAGSWRLSAVQDEKSVMFAPPPLRRAGCRPR